MAKITDNLAQLLEIKNSTSDSADLYFYGNIVSSWWGAWDQADQYPQAVKRFLDGVKGKKLNIYINSGGGALFAGMAIYNMLKRHQGYKTVHVDGLAASIASVIALAGDKVIIPANAFFMVHRPWITASGDVDELLKMVELLESAEKAAISVYAEHLKPGVSVEEIQKLVHDETWMTGEEAAKYFNVEVAPAVKAVAYAGELNFQKVPQSIQKKDLAQARLSLLKLKGDSRHD